MSTDSGVLPPPRATALEACGVFVGMLLLALLQIAVGGSEYLFHRQFWLDEIYTYRIVTDPDLLHSLRAIQSGIDASPPAMHLVLRAFTSVTGDSETAFRCASLMAIACGLIGLYLLLRSVVAPAVAIAGVLAVWTHPLTLHYAFEARFYAFWFAAVAWYAFLLNRARSAPSSRTLLIPLGVSSVFLCTVHYFGIITWTLVTVAEFSLRRAGANHAMRPLMVAMTGPLAFVVCIPTLLVHQRQVSTVATWVPEPTLEQITEFLTVIYAPKEFLLPAILVAVAAVLSLVKIFSRRAPRKTGNWRSLAGIAASVMLPPALLVVSNSVQPALVDRYAMPTVLAFAPLVAVLVSSAPRALTIMLCIILIITGAIRLRDETFFHLRREESIVEVARQIRRCERDSVILFEDQHTLYPVWLYSPAIRKSCFLLDFETGELPLEREAYRVWLRDNARALERFYPEIKSMKWSSARQRGILYVVPAEYVDSETPLPTDRFPGCTVEKIHGRLYRLRPAGFVEPRAADSSVSRRRQQSTPVALGGSRDGSGDGQNL